MFSICQPHPQALAKWYEAIDAKLSLTELIFTEIKAIVAAKKLAEEEMSASMLDEIDLCQQVEFTIKKYIG